MDGITESRLDLTSIEYSGTSELPTARVSFSVTSTDLRGHLEVTVYVDVKKKSYESLEQEARKVIEQRFQSGVFFP